MHGAPSPFGVMFPAVSAQLSAPSSQPLTSSPMLPLLLALAVSQQPTTPYWQQHVAYDISARLDEAAGVLAGTETITYTNHSPDTLTTFSLHLHLNAFRPGSRWADAGS